MKVPAAPAWALSLLVFIVPLLVFSPALRGGFVLDDRGQILANPAVRDFDLGALLARGYWANASETGRTFSSGGDLYRPLTSLSVALSHQLWGERPFGYHLENLLLHALACWLLLGLLRCWGLRPGPALLAALLFGVAPIHIEAVAGIVLRGELLAAIFAILYLRCQAGGRPLGLYLLGPLALLAALLSKESAIALPAIALLADRVFIFKARDRAGWRRRLPAYGAALGACAIYLGLRAAVLGHLLLADPQATYFHGRTLLVQWLTMARFACVHYLGGALLGAPLVFDFYPASFADAGPGEPLAWLCLAFWVALGLGSLYLAVRRRSIAAAGAVLFLLAIGPTANIAVRIGVIGATRLMYFPYLGIALVLAALGAALWQRCRSAALQRALALGAVLVLGAYSVQTVRRLAPWRSSRTLCEDILARAPHNALALGTLANEYFRYAYGLEAPPPELAGAPARAGYQRSYELYARCVAAYPRQWDQVLANLVRSAFEAGREGELPGVIDAFLRASMDSAQLLPALPGGSWQRERPLSAASYRALTGWSAALAPLARGPARYRLLHHLVACLPPYLAARASWRAWRLAAGPGARERLQRRLVAEVQRLRRSAANAAKGADARLRQMIASVYWAIVEQRCNKWLRAMRAPR